MRNRTKAALTIAAAIVALWIFHLAGVPADHTDPTYGSDSQVMVVTESTEQRLDRRIENIHKMMKQAKNEEERQALEDALHVLL
ncbi:hypothetical protein MUG87_00045 [Ectobacillus sp. JY-23]|uniref:hypothetical protein n=1 Tax=Ectobacillus sp. JY-23 TaxID=2933872 RepID=UPI001FF20F49|nr:hypothetical protein [Ectobacillus sp. JY-23]UOY92584.1 hypothetical protein MUG87_00045 [Ectobacillus sp. JY-23]